MRRAFVIEFAPVDRPQRNVFLPYLVGMARTRGVDVTWWRYGVPAALRHRSGEAGVGLPSLLLEGLRRQLREAPAAPVVFSHVPSARLHAVAAEAPGRRIAVATERPSAVDVVPGLEGISEGAGDWLEFLGLAPEEGAARGVSIFEAATPDFSYTPGNPEAEDMAALPCLVLADPCSYRRSVFGNPCFSGVDLTDCADRRGCSFCSIPGAAARAGAFSEDRTAVQLAALAATLPGGPGGSIRLIGDAALRHAETIVAQIIDAGLPGAGWEFDARADTIVESGDALRRALDRCVGTEHRLHLSLVGVENFSRTELERFNKGIPPEVNLEAIALLLHLEETCPEHFRFREHGGISMILFTPWTTLEDLQVNLATIRAAGIEGLSGKLLGARLRLADGLPITALARRDGLLADGYEDPAFDTAGLNLYDAELPWRFREAGVADACSVLIRIRPREDLAGDPLTVRIRRFVEEVGRLGVRPMDLALTVVDVQLETRAEAAVPGPVPGARRRIESLLEAVETRILGAVGAAAVSAAEQIRSESALTFLRAASHGPWTEGNLGHLAALVAAGIKPVAKLEDAPAEALQQYVERFALPNARTQEVPGSGGAHRHLFFGGSIVDVERVVHLSRRVVIDGEDGEGEDRRTLGRLLGYPACCVEAYGRDFPIHGQDALLHLRRRLDRPGVVPPELAPVNPYCNAVHVPCGLDCAASRELARRVVEVLFPEESVRAGYLASLRNPWLIMLDQDGQVVELVPGSEPGGRFAFRAGRVGLPSRWTDRVVEADEIVLEDERLLLLRRGAVHLDLSGRAFVWWHRAALQAEPWGRILRIRETIHRLQGGGPRPDMPSAAAHGPTARLRRRLAYVLARIERLGLGPVGMEARIEETHGIDHLLLTIVRNGHRVQLQVAALGSGGDAWFRCGDFSFSHPSGVLALTPEQRELTGSFIRLLILAIDLGRGGPRRGPDVLVNPGPGGLAC